MAAPDVSGLRALVLIAATPRWGDWFLPFWPIPDDRLDYLQALRPLDLIERIGMAVRRARRTSCSSSAVATSPSRP